VATVLNYAAEASTILAFLVVMPGACATARKRIREHRRSRHRPRYARPGRFCGRGGRHRLNRA